MRIVLMSTLVGMSLMLDSAFGQINVDYCSLGVNDRSIISDASMTASSTWGWSTVPAYGRLDQASGMGADVWIPSNRQKGEWIQVDLGSPKIVAGIVTQGRGTTGGGSTPDQWVTSYTASCRTSEDDDTVIMGDDGNAKVFPANNDRNTKVFNMFKKPMVCRYVRVYPQTWYNYNSMRMDIICGGCNGN